MRLNSLQCLLNLRRLQKQPITKHPEMECAKYALTMLKQALKLTATVEGKPQNFSATELKAKVTTLKNKFGPGCWPWGSRACDGKCCVFGFSVSRAQATGRVPGQASSKRGQVKRGGVALLFVSRALRHCAASASGLLHCYRW